MLTALVRDISPAIIDCALTFLDREPIDLGLARDQHRQYEEHLRSLGARVVRLPSEPELPDAVFVEDTAVVLDEIVIVCSPSLESRRPELDSVSSFLRRSGEPSFISGTARLEGGDVLTIHHTLFVGRSCRTNDEGIRQFRALVEPLGYRVVPVNVDGCLHLKTACTYIGNNQLLANPYWFAVGVMSDEFEILSVAREEPFAANALYVSSCNAMMLSASAPRTAEVLRKKSDLALLTVDISELEKAEAGLTCCSIIFHDRSPRRDQLEA
jgi:dimethylargininase